MVKAIAENRTHYLPTTGVPRLRQLLAEKMRQKNGIPIGSDDEIVPTNGGTHAIWAVIHALFEPGDEVIVSDPEWPPTMAIAIAAKATPVAVPLYESLGWRWDLDELEQAITPRTRGDLRELAEQPERRRSDARRSGTHCRHRARARSLGASPTRRTRTCCFAAST